MSEVLFYHHGFLYEGDFYNYKHIMKITVRAYKNFEKGSCVLIKWYSGREETRILKDVFRGDHPLAKMFLKEWNRYIKDQDSVNEIKDLKSDINSLKSEIQELKQIVKDLMFAPGMPGYLEAKKDFDHNAKN